MMDGPTACHPPSESLVQSSAAPLPPELLFIIFQYMWNRLATQRTSLARCSLVCTRWRPVAQELLFTEVVLHRESAAQSFLSAIKKDSQLGRATKVLSIKVDSWPSAALPQHRGLSPLTTYGITVRCPFLYQINLQVSSYLYGTELKTLLHLQTFEKLQALYLYLRPEYTLESRTTIQDVLRFLSHFHALSHLRLRGIRQLSCPAGLVTPPPSPSYQLFEFCWMNYGCSHNSDTHTHFNLITNWLFLTSSEKLRIFEFEDHDTMSRNSLQGFISKYAKNLASIRVNLPMEALAAHPIHLSEACPELRELILTKTDMPLQNLKSILPIPNLQHLAIARTIHPEDVTLDAIDWVISLPNLRRITLGTNGNHGHDWIRRWQVRCGSHIDVGCVPSIADEYKKEDLVAELDFPRGRTIGNLVRMVIP
ncbi:hypothetical protein FRC03_011660 [Tulasnella sp. 419]|nr:hypothetical protein FRC03_011660 [Tulasnella sp. 419]